MCDCGCVDEKDFEEKPAEEPEGVEETEGYEDEEDALVVLADENGEETEFECIGSVQYEGSEYVVLLPLFGAEGEGDEDEEEAEVLILKVEPGEDEDDERFVSVDSEETLNTVFAVFKDEFADQYDFAE